jgi:hypothetical protein
MTPHMEPLGIVPVTSCNIFLPLFVWYVRFSKSKLNPMDCVVTDLLTERINRWRSGLF